jgi:hypothetical protein
VPTGIINITLMWEDDTSYREIEASATVVDTYESYGEDRDGRRGTREVHRQISDLEMTWLDNGEDVSLQVFNKMKGEALVEIDSAELST